MKLSLRTCLQIGVFVVLLVGVCLGQDDPNANFNGLSSSTCDTCVESQLLSPCLQCQDGTLAGNCGGCETNSDGECVAKTYPQECPADEPEPDPNEIPDPDPDPVPADCIFACTEDYTPVCGSDGVTYSNGCNLEAAACVDDSITKSCDGECDACADEPEPNPNPVVIDPVEDPDPDPVEDPDCDFGCGDDWTPVCGSDGVTYSNACELERAICIDDSIGKACEGECDACLGTCVCGFPELYCQADNPCSSGEDCECETGQALCLQTSESLPQECENSQALCEWVEPCRATEDPVDEPEVDPPVDEVDPPVDPPVDEVDLCANKDCTSGKECFTDGQTAVCAPSCDAGFCDANLKCISVDVVCITSPCPPVPECFDAEMFCQDQSTGDDALCDAREEFGFGLVEGECQLIAGCPPGPENLFDTIEDCKLVCEDVIRPVDVEDEDERETVVCPVFERDNAVEDNGGSTVEGAEGAESDAFDPSLLVVADEAVAVEPNDGSSSPEDEYLALDGTDCEGSGKCFYGTQTCCNMEKDLVACNCADGVFTCRVLTCENNDCVDDVAVEGDNTDANGDGIPDGEAGNEEEGEAEEDQDVSCDAACITLYDPVCGSDGVEYSNMCKFEHARDCEEGLEGLVVACEDGCDDCDYDFDEDLDDGNAGEETQDDDDGNDDEDDDEGDSCDTLSELVDFCGETFKDVLQGRSDDESEGSEGSEEGSEEDVVDAEGNVLVLEVDVIAEDSIRDGEFDEEAQDDTREDNDRGDDDDDDFDHSSTFADHREFLRCLRESVRKDDVDIETAYVECAAEVDEDSVTREVLDALEECYTDCVEGDGNTASSLSSSLIALSISVVGVFLYKW